MCPNNLLYGNKECPLQHHVSHISGCFSLTLSYMESTSLIKMNNGLLLVCSRLHTLSDTIHFAILHSKHMQQFHNLSRPAILGLKLVGQDKGKTFTERIKA